MKSGNLKYGIWNNNPTKKLKLLAMKKHNKLKFVHELKVSMN